MYQNHDEDVFKLFQKCIIGVLQVYKSIIRSIKNPSHFSLSGTQWAAMISRQFQYVGAINDGLCMMAGVV